MSTCCMEKLDVFLDDYILIKRINRAYNCSEIRFHYHLLKNLQRQNEKIRYSSIILKHHYIVDTVNTNFTA